MPKFRTTGLAAILVLVFLITAAPASRAAGSQLGLRERMLGIYVHGVTAQLASDVVSADELPALRALLADPSFPRRDNIVAFLAHLDGDAGVAPILAFLANPPAPVAAPEEDRALLLAPQALGLIAGRGSRPALDALLAMTGPDPGVLGGAASRGADAVALLSDLQERALRALAVTGKPEGRTRLIAIAQGDTVLASRRDLRVLAGELVVGIDEKASPNRSAAPESSPWKLDRGPAGHPALAVVPKDPEVLQPQVLDISANSHDSPLSWANHPAVSTKVTDNIARDILRQSALRLSRADHNDDISCCVNVRRLGTQQSFGSLNDGLDTIDSASELNAVLGNSVARVKVVREINYCGGPGQNIIGCAPVPGNTMTVVRFSTISNEGALWLHEYGHNTGLSHNESDSRAVMYPTLLTANLVSQAECNAYHFAGANLGATCNDADNDAIAGPGDNCPNVSNPGQQDQENDGIGDACDPCPTLPVCDTDGDGAFDDTDNCVNVSNPNQADGDDDNVGDACDPCPFDPFNDADQDFLCYPADNCPSIGNPGQQNSDGDANGDACDPCPFDALDDGDGDTLCANVDNCPTIANLDQADQDGDGVGNVCDPDVDGDGVNEASDNCPGVANPGQQNADGDAHGDACDACPLDALNDADADGHCANVDNCPAVANPDQLDWDGDNVGNPCDPDREGDGLANVSDNCPDDLNPQQQDRDRNGVGNACDRIRTVAHGAPAQFATIQAAIDAASSGEMVVVAPGVYHENLTMKGGVDVVGPGPALATVDGTGTPDVPIVSMIDLSSSARFSGFKVTGASLDSNLYGGGFKILRSDAEVDGNLVTGNQASLGAGFYMEGDGSGVNSFAPVITNNVIAGNEATFASGAMAVYYATPGWKIRHNTVVDNVAGDAVAGINVGFSDAVEISNNVITGNESSNPVVADGIALTYSTGIVLHHNDVHGNSSGNYSPPGSDPTGTNGNISVAPGFTNPGAGDYTPGPGSPLVDAGSDPADPPRDGAGHPRPLEGNGAGPSFADIGAIERALADADADGIPNGSDKCPYVADPAQSDSDGDGVGNACDNCASAANANQSDLDRDGVGDVCDNCPVTANPLQTDSHGYGVGDACALPDADNDSVPDSNDCAPSNPAAYFVPAEIASLALSGKTTTSVSWPAQDAGSGTRYDVAGGLLATLRADHSFVAVGCLSNDQASLTYSDVRANPAQGNGYYYLLRAVNACGTGTYGQGSGAPDPRDFLDNPGTGPCP